MSTDISDRELDELALLAPDLDGIEGWPEARERIASSVITPTRPALSRRTWLVIAGAASVAAVTGVAVLRPRPVTPATPAGTSSPTMPPADEIVRTIPAGQFLAWHWTGSGHDGPSRGISWLDSRLREMVVITEGAQRSPQQPRNSPDYDFLTRAPQDPTQMAAWFATQGEGAYGPDDGAHKHADALVRDFRISPAFKKRLVAMLATLERATVATSSGSTTVSYRYENRTGLPGLTYLMRFSRMWELERSWTERDPGARTTTDDFRVTTAPHFLTRPPCDVATGTC